MNKRDDIMIFHRKVYESQPTAEPHIKTMDTVWKSRLSLEEAVLWFYWNPIFFNSDPQLICADKPYIQVTF